MELGSSHDLLVWLVDVWESESSRAGKLARGDSVIDLAVTEGKIEEGPTGLMDGFAYWFEELRTAGWIAYDDTEAERVRMPGTSNRSRNDVVLSRSFIPTAAGANWVKSSLTAASVGHVAVDLSGLLNQVIEEADAPEETKEEARRWLSRLGDTAVSGAAAESIVRVVLAVTGGLR